MPSVIPVARPLLGEEEIAAAVQVLRSGQVVQGRQVAEFEAEFAALVDGRHCVAVSSGTSALWLCLLALGIGAGDEVIVPSFSFAATASAVALTGATPVFADIDPVTYCADPAAVAAAITPRTAAVIPVHLYGHPAPMDALVPLVARHGLALIEDAAQAHGAALHGRPAGAFGTAAAFSFYPTKNMATIEGGLIATPDPGLARRLRLLRNQGMDTPYNHESVGTNARMSDVAAAIARQQLRKLGNFTHARRDNAAALDAALDGTITCPQAALGARHVYHQYTISIPGGPGARDAFARALLTAGVAAGFLPGPHPTVIRGSPGPRPWPAAHRRPKASTTPSWPVPPDCTRNWEQNSPPRASRPSSKSRSPPTQPRRAAWPAPSRRPRYQPPSATSSGSTLP